MKKSTVYLDTSIISANWYEAADVAMLARRLRTREWWELERAHFAIWVTGFGEAELGAGMFPRQSDCLKMQRRLHYLPVTTLVRDLINQIVRQKIVPADKAGDAAHLACATAHDIDFLLTWNYAHMANPVVQARFDRMCATIGLVAPMMVSPESIPQVRLGQSIRRVHE
jgi:hypothetical protein